MKAIFSSKVLYEFLERNKDGEVIFWSLCNDSLSFGYTSKIESILGHVKDGREKRNDFDKKQWARLRKSIRFIPEQPITLFFNDGWIQLTFEV